MIPSLLGSLKVVDGGGGDRTGLALNFDVGGDIGRKYGLL